MNWNQEVDAAFARRRDALLQELLDNGLRVVDDVGAIAGACAAKHPFVHVGLGVATGACMTMGRGGATSAAPRRRSRLFRTAATLLKLVPLGALLHA